MQIKPQSSQSHSLAVKERRNAATRSPVLEEAKAWHPRPRMRFLSISEREWLVCLSGLDGDGSVVGILK